jgi:two-component system sensor histidine kinase QseC
LLSEQGRHTAQCLNAKTADHPGAGFNSETKDQHEWRTFTLYNEGEQTWLIVAERDDERSELASKMATLTMLPSSSLPFLLGLPGG